MFKQRKMKQLGARLDGESRYAGNEPLETNDAELARHRDAVLMLRQGAAEVARTPEINDAQFGAFMQGIRDGIETPAPRLYGLWTLASVAAATLVLIFSAFAFFTTGSEPVRATEVESVSTELDGVTIRFNDNQDGVSTVWVSMPESDLW